MSKSYEMPEALALALITERTQFLSLLSDEQLRQEAGVQLIRDLIDDRVKLRQRIVQVADSLTQAVKLLQNTAAKYSNFLDYLDGKIAEESEGEDHE